MRKVILLLIALICIWNVYGMTNAKENSIKKLNSNISLAYPWNIIDKNKILVYSSDDKLGLLNINSFKVEKTKTNGKYSTGYISDWFVNENYICGKINYDEIQVTRRVDNLLKTFTIKEQSYSDTSIYSFMVEGNNLFVLARDKKYSDRFEKRKLIRTRLIQIDLLKDTIENVYEREFENKKQVCNLFGPKFVGKNEVLFSDCERMVKFDILNQKLTSVQTFQSQISAPFLIKKEMMYLITVDDLIAVSIRDLKIRWHTKYYRLKYDFVSQPPNAFDDGVVIGTTTESYSANWPTLDNCAVSMYNLNTGKLIWKVKCRGEMNVTPIICKDRVYFSTINYQNNQPYSIMYVIDKDGNITFESQLINRIEFLVVNNQNDVLLFGSDVYKFSVGN